MGDNVEDLVARLRELLPGQPPAPRRRPFVLWLVLAVVVAILGAAVLAVQRVPGFQTDGSTGP